MRALLTLLLFCLIFSTVVAKSVGQDETTLSSSMTMLNVYIRYENVEYFAYDKVPLFIYVSAGGNPISNATVTLTSSGGYLSSYIGATDIYGGLLAWFTSAEEGTFTVSAKAQKRGYNDGYCSIQINIRKASRYSVLWSLSLENVGEYSQIWYIADINNDGISDIIMKESEKGVKAISGKDARILWQNENFTDSIREVMTCCDVNEDGKPDVIFDYANDGIIIALDGSTGQKIWQNTVVPPHQYWIGVTGMKCVEDIDSDGIMDIVASWIEPGGKQRGIVMISGKSGAKIWELLYSHWCGNLDVLGDINNDGTDDLVACVGYEIYAFSASDGKTIWSRKFTYLISILIVVPDLNNDGTKDIFTSTYDEKKAYLLSGKDGKIVWTTKKYYETGDAWRPYGLSWIQDLTNDGKPELLVVTDAFAYMLDGNDGNKIWRSPLIGSIGHSETPYPTIFSFDDVTDDMYPDIAVSIYGSLIVLDGKTGNLIWRIIYFVQHPGLVAPAVLVSDIDSDGVRELAVLLRQYDLLLCLSGKGLEGHLNPIIVLTSTNRLSYGLGTLVEGSIKLKNYLSTGVSLNLTFLSALSANRTIGPLYLEPNEEETFTFDLFVIPYFKPEIGMPYSPIYPAYGSTIIVSDSVTGWMYDIQAIGPFITVLTFDDGCPSFKVYDETLTYKVVGDSLELSLFYKNELEVALSFQIFLTGPTTYYEEIEIKPFTSGKVGKLFDNLPYGEYYFRWCISYFSNSVTGSWWIGPLQIPSSLTRANPTVTLIPNVQAGIAGSTLTHTVSVTNNDPLAYSASSFSLTYSVPSGWSASLSKTSVTLNPGETDSSIILSVTSPTAVSAGDYTISVTATNTEAASYQGIAYDLCRITENVDEARKTLYENYAMLLNGMVWMDQANEVSKMFGEDFMNSFTNPLAILKKFATSKAIGEYSNAELIAKELGGLISFLKWSDVSYTINWAYSKAQADPVVIGFYGQHAVNASQEMLDILSLIQQNKYSEAKPKIGKLINYLQVAKSQAESSPTLLPVTKQSVSSLFDSIIKFLSGEQYSLLEDETSVKLSEKGHKLYLHIYDGQGHHVGINQTDIEIGIVGAIYLDLGQEIEVILPPTIVEFKYVVDASQATEEKEPYNITITTLKKGGVSSTVTEERSISKGDTNEFSVKILEDKTIQTTPIPTQSNPWPMFVVAIIISVLVLVTVSILILRKRFSSTSAKSIQ